jgi:hypothetical protein
VVVAAVVAPTEQRRRHFDHIAFERAIERGKDGAGLYQAFVDGLAAIDSVVTQVRSVRQLWLLAAWVAIPAAALQPTYFGFVVLGSTAVAASMQRYPIAALLLAGWLARAGVFGGVDAWLLFELWCTPFILGSCLAWVRGRDGAAALAALGAVLVRETAVLLPLGMLVAARSQGRPIRPWVASLAAGAAALGLHWFWSIDHLADEGNEAAIIGTGSSGAVISMTHFIVLPAVVGLLLWVVGLVLLWRSALRGAVGLAAMPALGFLVDRPYWGFLAMPLCVLALGGLPPWPGPEEPGSSVELVPDGAGNAVR